MLPYDLQLLPESRSIPSCRHLLLQIRSFLLHLRTIHILEPSVARFDKMMNLNSDAFNLREPAGFEVLSADGEWVEFRIVCPVACIAVLCFQVFLKLHL